MGGNGRSHARRAAPWVLAVLVGVVGAWLGALLLARVEVPMGPFRVELRPGFGRGVTDIGIPPFGRVIADTNAGPLGISATLVDVGVEQLTDVVGRIGIDGLVEEVERDALSQLRSYAFRLVAVAALGGFLAGALVFRRRWPQVLVAGLVGLFAAIGVEALAVSTYRPAAFTEPRYTGSLGTAAKLIGPVREATDHIGDFRASLENLIEEAAGAYSAIQAEPVAEGGTVRVLHISDIHASFLGMDFAREVAEAFDVDLVIDTGDLTSFGTPVEDLIVTKIPIFDRPYVFVRGNHDPKGLQREVRDVPNTTVVDGNVVHVDGLDVYGLGYPAFTPAWDGDVGPEAFAAEARAAGATVSADLSTLDRPPDIVAVHDDRMAETVAGRVPLVISGHTHATTARVVNGTLFLRIGTTGGSGAGIFRGLDVPFSAEILTFSTTPELRLVAYDVVEQLPATGSLTVTRHLVSRDFGALVLTPTPTVSGSESVPVPASSATWSAGFASGS